MKVPTSHFGAAILFLCALLPSSSALNEKDIIDEFHTRTGGINWTVKWNLDSPVCDRKGITCDDDGTVSDIVLNENGLTGAIYKDIWTLPHLRYFSATNNNIYDAGFEGFSIKSDNKVQVIDLSYNIVESLKGIGKAPFALRFLMLTNNKISGPFPSELTDLTNIRKLYLNNNQLTGQIPNSIGNFGSLLELYVFGNELTGTIPKEIGLLKKAEIITLAENQLHGTIPEEVNDLANLHTFSVHNSLTTGSISGTIPSFDKSPGINELRLDGNALTGTIPSDLFKIAETDDEVIINFDNNNITGVVPPELLRFSDLELGIVGNAIASFPFEFCSKDKWMNGLVMQYGCDAIACGVNTFGKSGRQESDTKNCTACAENTNLFQVGGYECELSKGVDPKDVDSGDYASDISKELTALTSFYMNADPKKWVKQEGWETLYSEGDDDEYYNVYIDDELNYCDDLFGIKCEEGRVTEIRLPYNGLSGEIHSSLLDLEKLEVLDLSYNEVYFSETYSGSDGPLDSNGFHGLKKAKSLKDLRMSGTKTTNWKGISGATNLTKLYLNNLELEGDFPDEIYKLTNLQILQAKSSTITGEISEDVKKLAKLTSLNLYYNDLSGKLPTQLGLLTKLEKLELSENKFTGSIPNELGSLIKLTELAIHSRLRDDDVGLKGKLPSFSKLTQLSFLSLDSNRLTGEIPTDFLAGYTDDKRLFIGLAENQLSGAVPTGLQNFPDVYLSLVGNKITELDDTFKNMGEWMDGEVTTGGTNAIMCPPRFFSHLGNSNSFTNVKCTACENNEELYGAMTCTDADPNDPPDAANPERAILIEFFYATDGKNWTDSSGWDDNQKTVCQFYGITCENEHVKKIELKENGLSAEIPPSLWSLEKLKTIDLSHNKISIDFTGIGGTEVINLDLSSTRVAGVDGISNFDNLKSLDVSDCTLITDLEEVYSISGLETLKTNNLNLNSQISQAIFDLTALRNLSCNNCGLYGVIPNKIGDLQKLQFLDLAKNSLAGSLPTEISNLSDLYHLNLKKNDLEGTLIEFKGNKILTHLDLSVNLLTGSVPDTFLEGLVDNNDIGVNEEIKIDLSFNHLDGPFPDMGSEGKGFDGNKNVFIDLGGNDITKLPSNCKEKKKWMGGLVEDNGCDAILCPKEWYNHLGRLYKDDKDEIIACKKCDSGTGSDIYGSIKCTERSSSELEALTLLYKGLNGDGWIKKRNWMTNTPVCDWYGIGCEKKDNMVNIVSIQLDNNNMKGDGESFSKVFELTHLRRLDVSGNEIALVMYSVKDFIPNLEALGLSSTGANSLDGIEYFKNLKELYVGDNFFTGPLPNSLFDLEKLETLEISYNQFDDNLKSLSNLKNLEELYASNNAFSGQIPYGLGQLQNLQKLDLSKNKFSSSIPSTFKNLTNIRQLSLQSQNPGINGDIYDLKSLNLLERLELQNNKLTGTIPDDFLKSVSRVDSPLWINLDFNALDGTVPETLKRLKKLNLYVVGNRLQDLPTSFCNGEADGWMGGEVALYECAAIGCPVGTYSSSGRASKGENCVKCKNSIYFGSTVCSVTNADEKAILKALYLKTNGDNWISNKNWNDDTVDICDWEGITCEGNLGPENSGVTSVNLQEFGLIGDIPSIVYSLPYLQALNLKKNRISISFEKIGDAVYLETLNLSETGLESLKGLSNAASLKTLHLTENKLSLELKDTEIFELTHLENIFISWNNISGTIPKDIGKMSSLVSFYAYDNMINGVIPRDIGKLDKLQELVLSENQITGQLPDEIGELPSLELFAVYRFLKSGPKLSGTLPAFHKSISLKTLYLDYNNIAGPIPENFLEQTNNDVEATLSNNLLTGAIPSRLDNHDQEIILEFEGNKINDMDGNFCDNNRWMDGLVRAYGCDAILCKPHFANADGRATLETPLCEACPNRLGAEYFGSQSCDAVLEEEVILKKLYNECNGAEWVDSKNWMTTANICDWFGITCENGYVTRIIMEGNNVEGRPPKELFQLRFLKEICFHSNIVDFRFDGIGKARELTTLHLGDTGLSSMKGISDAVSLQILQLSGNRLTGKFPDELLDIHNLKTLDLGRNSLEGVLPSFGELQYIQKLVLANNKFSGALPTFTENWKLSDLDFSHNSFDKPIPDNFLDGTPTSQKLLVDISYNRIPGVLPTELAKFEDLAIDISENKIIQLHVDSCKVKEFGCDSIACRPGTYNVNGRETSAEDPCLECAYGEVFYGKRECKEKSSRGYKITGIPFVGILVSTAMIMLI